MEPFLQDLYYAENILRRVNHMVYITYPIIKDKRLVLKIIIETKNAITNCINTILRYEHIMKRIKLSKNSDENLRGFKLKLAPKYNISIIQMNKIMKLFDLVKKHQNSPFEFKKNEKIIILSEKSTPDIITIETAKDFLNLAKELLEKSKFYINF